MGRSVTPPYRVEMSGVTPSAWHVKTRNYGCPGNGKPTNQNLEKFVLAFGKSLEMGGTNQHVSKALGYIPYPTWAKIVRQVDGEIVAEWQAPMFMIWS